ncbi:hypothetical protein CASFOL_017959 [Castilleja foliolosa]|uniref:Uncharacterized protein n=1 Tax=Castilleja foliolosa TaxID=1961234 RepID=A0ABD3D8Q7_9LAMI
MEDERFPGSATDIRSQPKKDSINSRILLQFDKLTDEEELSVEPFIEKF